MYLSNYIHKAKKVEEENTALQSELLLILLRRSDSDLHQSCFLKQSTVNLMQRLLHSSLFFLAKLEAL
jgi:hypothetical protein